MLRWSAMLETRSEVQKKYRCFSSMKIHFSFLNQESIVATMDTSPRNNKNIANHFMRLLGTLKKTSQYLSIEKNGSQEVIIYG